MELDVFKENLTRKEILEFARLREKHANVFKKCKINIHRNHALRRLSVLSILFCKKVVFLANLILALMMRAFCLPLCKRKCGKRRIWR